MNRIEPGVTYLPREAMGLCAIVCCRYYRPRQEPPRGRPPSRGATYSAIAAMVKTPYNPIMGLFFRSTWELLSETTAFIDMREDADQYQDLLRDMRRRLQESARDPEKEKKVREELIALRKTFRRNGFDVSLGSLDILCEGFRNETALNEGYRRMVLLLAGQTVLFEVGMGNHRDLWEALDQRSRGLPLSVNREFHHLWFLWKGKVLHLAGADSESKEDYQRFCHIVRTKKLFLLAALKKLR